MHAQSDWPSRTVRFVIPFPPGGGGDVVCRAAAEKTSEIVKQPVIVENRTGGNAVIAATAVAQAAPDGYTFLWEGNNHLTNKLLVKDINIDYRTAFVPVMLTARFPQVVAVRADFPAQTFDEFVKYAQANPGKVTCGTPAAGGMGHLALELLQRLGDLRVVHTPYKGGPEATRDLMGGQIDSVLLTTSTIRPAVAGQQGARDRGVERAARGDVPGRSRDRRALSRLRHGRLERALRARRHAGTSSSGKANAAVTQALKDPAIVAKMAPTGTVLSPTTTRGVRGVAQPPARDDGEDRSATPTSC